MNIFEALDCYLEAKELREQVDRNIVEIVGIKGQQVISDRTQYIWLQIENEVAWLPYGINEDNLEATGFTILRYTPSQVSQDEKYLIVTLNEALYFFLNEKENKDPELLALYKKVSRRY